MLYTLMKFNKISANKFYFSWQLLPTFPLFNVINKFKKENEF